MVSEMGRSRAGAACAVPGASSRTTPSTARARTARCPSRGMRFTGNLQRDGAAWVREVLRAGRPADVRTCGRPDARRASPGLRGRLDHLHEFPDLGCLADLHPELVEDRLQV